MLIKDPDWRSRLNQYIDLNKNKPFKWGQMDCTVFALGCVDFYCNNTQLVSGECNWKNKKESQIKLSQFKDLEDAARQVLVKYGLKEIENTNYTQVGDIVVFRQAGQLTAGIYIGMNKAVCTGRKGLEYLEIKQFNAWGVRK